MMFGFEILGMVRSDVVLRWIKQAYREFAGEDALLLFICFGGFSVGVSFSVLMVRSFRNSAALRMGFDSHTSPRTGCCARTVGQRAGTCRNDGNLEAGMTGEYVAREADASKDTICSCGKRSTAGASGHRWILAKVFLA